MLSMEKTKPEIYDKYIKAITDISRAITSDLYLEDILKLIVMVTAKVTALVAISVAALVTALIAAATTAVSKGERGFGCNSHVSAVFGNHGQHRQFSSVGEG